MGVGRHATAPSGSHYHGASRLSARGTVVSARDAMPWCIGHRASVHDAQRLIERVDMAQCERHIGSVHGTLWLCTWGSVHVILYLSAMPQCTGRHGSMYRMLLALYTGCFAQDILALHGVLCLSAPGAVAHCIGRCESMRETAAQCTGHCGSVHVML